jgi:hypothetical protein
MEMVQMLKSTKDEVILGRCAVSRPATAIFRFISIFQELQAFNARSDE